MSPFINFFKPKPKVGKPHFPLFPLQNPQPGENMFFTLNCALVGAGSTLPVPIDENGTVGDLKRAIKMGMPTLKNVDADMLQLFVAKRDGVWLYKAQAEAGLAETSGLEPLDGRQSSLQCMGWSGNDLAELDEQTQVNLLHVLVTVPQKEQIFPTYRLYSGGINVRLPHLPRAVLVERLLATVLMADFVLLSSPLASGKTSLLALFHERCWASYHCEAVSLNHSDSASDILLRIGIDISNQTCSLGINGASIVMLDDAPQPNEVLPFCLSDTMAQKIGRLYVKKDPVPSSTELQSFLIKCLLEDSMPLPMHGDDRICFERLKMAGIIAQDANSFVRFASPMAKRYYSKYLFPNRGHRNPSSRSDLITKVIGKMSASVLKKSTVGKKDFPKEATFQHQLISGIAAVTEPTCSICPELSKTFPSSPQQPSRRIKGEVDFYLDGSLQWAIELLVNGKGITEHMARFASGGKYYALRASDYAVVDSRCNKKGEVTNVMRMEKRISVFFKRGDYSSCKCLFGLNEDVVEIRLEN